MNQFNRIAIVHDDFVQNGGAEKIAEAFLEIFPTADLFTSILSSEWRSKLLNKHPKLKIYTSFINSMPLSNRIYKFFAILYPIAFLLFNFQKYDLVISSSARFAHGIRTPKNVLHISYIHSPARMIWEPRTYFSLPVLFLVYPVILVLRFWDKVAATFPTMLLANSNTTKQKIKKYWNRSSEVIYPFYELKPTIQNPKPNKVKEYYLIVSRLERWKRIDLAIKVCADLKEKLIIVGEGKYRKALENLANAAYVNFTGRLSDEDLIHIYLNSKALILTQKEDFGITAIEAESLGIPVIAYKSGGATETIAEDKTGVFFDKQDVDSLKLAISKFSRIVIDPQMCIIQANKFTKEVFMRRILDKLKHG